MKKTGWRGPLVVAGIAGLAGFIGIAWAAVSQGVGVEVAARQTAAEPLPVVGEALDVRVVNVEVLAVDPRGKRVTGLKPGDFRLKVDGKPVPIEYFTEVKDGQAVAAGAPAPEAGAPPAATHQPGIQAGAPIGTRYLVFVDDLFSIKNKRDDLLAGMKKDLDRIGPQDSMTIVAWEGGRLVQLAGWTSSRQELAKALDKAIARPSRGLEQRLRLEHLLDDSRFVVGSEGVTWTDNDTVDEVLDHVIGENPGLTLAEFDYGRTLARQVGNASLAVMSAMRGAGDPPGRKVLLLLAGGWPFSVEGFVRASQPPGLANDLPDSQVSLHALTATANLLGYSIYPLDVPGLTSVMGDIRDNPLANRGVSAPISVYNPQRAQTPTSMSVDPAPSPYPVALARAHGSARESEVQATLLFLAQETGGRALLNGNRKLGLATADEDTRSYYWLGFTPNWQRNGRAHKVEVEVLRKKVGTRARRSFIDLSPVESAMMTVESALLYGQLPDAEPLAIRLGQPVRKDSRITEIPVTLDIPASAVTLLPVDGRYAGKAELRLAAMDEKGNQSHVPTVTLRLVSPRQPSANGKLRYETRVSLRGRTSHLVAAIYDPLTGRMAAGRVDVPIPEK